MLEKAISETWEEELESATPHEISNNEISLSSAASGSWLSTHKEFPVSSTRAKILVPDNRSILLTMPLKLCLSLAMARDPDLHRVQWILTQDEHEDCEQFPIDSVKHVELSLSDRHD
ncbi:hypothetical protein ACFE04_013958 [Oxalis oulophora]